MFEFGSEPEVSEAPDRVEEREHAEALCGAERLSARPRAAAAAR